MRTSGIGANVNYIRFTLNRSMHVGFQRGIFRHASIYIERAISILDPALRLDEQEGGGSLVGSLAS